MQKYSSSTLPEGSNICYLKIKRLSIYKFKQKQQQESLGFSLLMTCYLASICSARSLPQGRCIEVIQILTVDCLLLHCIVYYQHPRNKGTMHSYTDRLQYMTCTETKHPHFPVTGGLHLSLCFCLCQNMAWFSLGIPPKPISSRYYINYGCQLAHKMSMTLTFCKWKISALQSHILRNKSQPALKSPLNKKGQNIILL